MYIANVVNYKDSDYLLDKHRAEMRKKGFVWRAYLLALSGESSELYEHIEEKWNDLDVITGEEIVFIFANDEASTLLHVGNETRRSSYSPRTSKYSIGENNAALIDHFKRVANISIDQLPCLVFDNLISDNREPIIIPLRNDSDVVSIMKYISIRTRDYLERINNIREEIIRGGYRKIEYYNDMKKRFVRTCLESKLIDENEVYTNLLDFENNDNPYAERRLQDMWLLVCDNSDRQIYGNYRKGLIERVCSTKREIVNFNYRNKQFERMISDLDSLQDALSEVIKGIDTCRCSEDAFLYAKTQIEELELVFHKYSIDENIGREIIRDLRKNISFKNDKDYFSEYNKKEILNRIRESEPVKYIDDISRIIFILEIIFAIGALL